MGEYQEYQEPEIAKILKPLSNEERVDTLVNKINVYFSKDINLAKYKVSWAYSPRDKRYLFTCNQFYIDFVEKAVTDLRWDILGRMIELLELKLRGMNNIEN